MYVLILLMYQSFLKYIMNMHGKQVLDAWKLLSLLSEFFCTYAKRFGAAANRAATQSLFIFLAARECVRSTDAVLFFYDNCGGKLSHVILTIFFCCCCRCASWPCTICANVWRYWAYPFPWIHVVQPAKKIRNIERNSKTSNLKL